jgi:glycosyltransferase involved in cell wall biosynthesis
MRASIGHVISRASSARGLLAAGRDSFGLCQVHLERDDPGEHFARAHAERLPCRVSVVHGDAERPLYLDEAPLRSAARPAEFLRMTRRGIAYWRGGDADRDEISALYRLAFRRAECDAVLIEFGHVAVQAMEACAQLALPMIVHFHGFDVYARPMLERYGGRYGELFAQAAALVAPSQAMRDELLRLGAPREKTHYVPCGVDASRFSTGAPDRSPPTFLAVGRLVEKKAPHLTIAAFAEVRRGHPDARLRMLGDGRLRGPCEDLAVGLGVGESVSFLGWQPHDVVAAELRGARAFVQHSVVGSDGNSEATPQSILEASATGLPVVATRHAGIPEGVVDGETAFLVDERDVAGMAEAMERLLVDPALAAGMGRAGRRFVEERFSIESTIARLWDVIQAASTFGGHTSPRRAR